MFGWIQLTLVAATAGLFLVFFFFFRHPKPPQPPLHVSTSSKTLFNWADNPALVTDAIENGWSRFAFTEYISSLRSNRFVLGSCASGRDVTVDNVEISWEVSQGSADFMQKIRLNSRIKKIEITSPKLITKTTANNAVSVIKSALPLPGPVLGNLSPFPQEAYFEITILSLDGDENGRGVNGKGRLNSGEDENVMLIQENGLNKRDVNGNIEVLRGRSCTKDIVDGRNELFVLMSVGLTGGGSIPLKFPGCFPGSIGICSDGSIYLDGNKIVSEANIERWENPNKVIGCGYNPRQNKVFFTIDSKLVHEINCKGEEFGSPLYPTLASNSDVTLLVNFGQSTFKYAPANSQRTQNPCFIEPMANSPSLGYEDSKELFSMGRIDSQWLNRSTTRSGSYLDSVNKGMTKDFDEASEGDLFEIVVERNSYKKSPSMLS
ncbi:hypothetical protein QVD17_10379 [Tagetes erecta]|uniref:B30.2/SPRY domain-containing protein n=1 Tax=Tagetes erecta TaxID=13708 RepID=A0AAD8L0Y6_TARER|nr:hypothetical protein QVD17_10379 [Tagetes erecta]